MKIQKQKRKFQEKYEFKKKVLQLQRKTILRVSFFFFFQIIQNVKVIQCMYANYITITVIKILIMMRDGNFSVPSFIFLFFFLPLVYQKGPVLI